MYIPPMASSASETPAPGGHSYGAAIIPADELTAADVRGVLGGIRFTGWIAPAQDGCIVVLGEPGDGVVADGRRGIIEVAGVLAERVTGPVLAARVRRDRQLALVAWRGGQEVARYCSDPSVEPGADEDVLAEPFGAADAEVIADAWAGREAAEPLTELLDEELDPDSVFESERLGRVLRLLGLPAWLVAAGELPHALPRGPRTSELLRLRVGRTGLAGLALGALVRPVRRRRHPPAVIAEPPKGSGMGFEEWMF